MGLKLITDDKNITVFKKDRTTSAGNTFSTYSTSVGTKDSSGQYVNAYIDLVFPKGVTIPNKSIVKITDSFPMVSEYNEKKYTKWYVKEYEVVKPGEDDMGFVNVDDDVDLPFAMPNGR